MGVECFPGTSIEKPREKMLIDGIGSLTDEQLIALLLDTGTKGENVVSLSQRLLFEKGGLAGLFLSDEDDLKTKGVKIGKSARILAVREILRRLPFTQSFKVTDLSTLVISLRQFFLSRTKETALVLFLDRNKTVIKRDVFSSGEEEILFLPIGKIVRDAVSCSAKFCIVLHNHPSGIAFPSNEDSRTTVSLYRQLSLLNVLLMDSVIVTNEDTFSFRENGMSPYTLEQ